MRSLASDVVVTGISLTADGTFNRATVSIDTTVDHEDGLALYYFDPENVVLTRVPNQQYNNNRITATLSHFSDYIVLKEPQDDYVGMAASMREHLDNLDTDDADGDGFINSEDPSPYSAKTFKEYEDYLRYMYPGQDVVTVYVNQPGDYGEDKIIDGTRTGHSWISYTKSDGTTKSAGVYASEDDVLFNKKVPSQVRTSDNWYTSDDPDNKKSYTPNSTIQPESEYASVMIPFVVDPSYYDEFIDFINNYRKPYQLYDNNCTTFVMECLDVLDIPHYFNEYNEDTQDDGWLNSHLFKHMKDSNSPGHAAYNATEYYETRTVRPLQEKDGVVSYASPASYSTATMTDTEKVDDQVYFTSSDKVRWNGHTYQIIEVSMSWNAAKAYCEKQGGHLMTITSETEQEIASSLMQMGNKRQYWIGLDTQSGWVTGEAVTYTNWDAREPNSCVRRNQRERYTHILNVANPAVNGSARLKWNDMFNDNTFPGEESNFSLCTVGVLCEWDYEC